MYTTLLLSTDCGALATNQKGFPLISQPASHVHKYWWKIQNSRVGRLSTDTFVFLLLRYFSASLSSPWDVTQEEPEGMLVPSTGSIIGKD